MLNLKTQLKSRLSGAARVAILGIGSEMRGDDAAGMLVAKQLDEYYGKVNTSPAVKVFLGETTPENFTGQIKTFAPTHLVIVDAADLNERAGFVSLIDPDKTAGISFCTHQLPIKVMVDYLLSFIDAKVMIIGIQPKRIGFGDQPSQEIVAAAAYVSDMIKEAIKVYLQK